MQVSSVYLQARWVANATHFFLYAGVGGGLRLLRLGLVFRSSILELCREVATVLSSILDPRACREVLFSILELCREVAMDVGFRSSSLSRGRNGSVLAAPLPFQAAARGDSYAATRNSSPPQGGAADCRLAAQAKNMLPTDPCDLSTGSRIENLSPQKKDTHSILDLAWVVMGYVDCPRSSSFVERSQMFWFCPR